MVTFETFKQLALSFPETSEEPHFDKTSFRYKKKIFATYDEKKNQASLKLTAIDQSVFTDFDPTHIFAVPNAWGKQGWTIFRLEGIQEDLFADALGTAYENVGGKYK